MMTWLETHGGKLQFGLRMTFAALLSFAIAEALGLAQSYWTVLSSVIVIQGSVGGSVKAGVNRLVGTVGGAFCLGFRTPAGSVRLAQPWQASENLNKS